MHTHCLPKRRAENAHLRRCTHPSSLRPTDTHALNLYILSRLFCIFLLCLLMVTALTRPVQAAPDQVANALKKCSPPGWQAADQYTYTPNNLYRYINGAADFFIGYGFEKLTGSYYRHAVHPGQSLTVDVYDMGAGLHAFGVFQARRNSDAVSAGVGTASQFTDEYLSFYKDRYYVEVQCYMQGTGKQAVLRTAAEQLAGALPGNNRPPQELALLPEKNKIPGSEKYVRGGVLGHAFYETGITAEYKNKTDAGTAFIVFCGSPADATQAIQQHRDYLASSGKLCAGLGKEFPNGFTAEEPWHNSIFVMPAGAYVVGIYDVSDATFGRGVLKSIYRALQSSH